MKLKETFKTIILTGLVISALVLSSRIWLSEELWPDGYNSFLSKLFSAFNKSQTESLDLSQIYYPKQILVSKNNSSVIISTTHNQYKALNDILKGHIKSAICSTSLSETDDEEYKLFCKQKDSVFIGLYNFISFEMLADYYGASVSDEITELNHVKNILICPALDNSGFTLYAKNSDSKKVLKINVSEDVSALSDMMTKLMREVVEGTVSASFAFENNFDVKNENEKEKILLDSYMLINLNELSTPDIKSVNLMNPEIFSNNSYEKIARYFGVNTTTARRFTDTSGSVNLIENFGTLKFHSDGLLEYTAIDEGIFVASDVSSEYDAVKLAGEFTEGVNSLFTLPEDNSYVFSGVSWDLESTYTVNFDLLYMGVPLVFERDISKTETLTHPIEVKIKDGKIISYRQLFCGFRENNTELNVPNMISVLDKFYTVYDVKNNPDDIIVDIYSVYNFDVKQNVVNPESAVLLSNGKVVMIK
ncbi:MAG: hypothetical protein E7405_01740 [Ruminococcaceae bacterium]|nr:hypothetical protein [Oscillospiraceae bacterium]